MPGPHWKSPMACRVLAALETPDDLSKDDVRHLIEDIEVYFDGLVTLAQKGDAIRQAQAGAEADATVPEPWSSLLDEYYNMTRSLHHHLRD